MEVPIADEENKRFRPGKMEKIGGVQSGDSVFGLKMPLKKSYAKKVLLILGVYI